MVNNFTLYNDGVCRSFLMIAFHVQLNFTYCTYSGDVVCKSSGKEELTLIEFILEMEICHRSAFPKIKKLSSVVTNCPGKCILEQFGNNMCKLSTLYKLEICILRSLCCLPTARPVVFNGGATAHLGACIEMI
ncbi:hypothetical protein T01_12849 [Trichinella spiralis]|uniref:Uncharacterized protein n=1 Tax=Trichinella spiralis TaxID=6334 RepID=A0A0V1B6E7_TRISP|nr:hypothetical protein T01_4435 [Trichinella spiralis]KRY32607.1 hypothetical protein T01_12849 [Trichinella spiralis]